MSENLAPDLLTLTTVVAQVEANGAVVEDIDIAVTDRSPRGVAGAMSAMLGREPPREVTVDLTLSTDEYDGDVLDLDDDESDDRSGTAETPDEDPRDNAASEGVQDNAEVQDMTEVSVDEGGS